MEYNPEKKEILLNKRLNLLDKFVLDFTKVLERHSGYVIVSGYVSILLGRARGSEDVDYLIPEMTFSKFSDLYSDLIQSGFECANTTKVDEAFDMLDEHAIRFYKGTPVPNIEFKKISNNIHKEALVDKIKVNIKRDVLYISPLELQIVYKLSLMAKGSVKELSSDKDFEDAKHIYEVFKEQLDMQKIDKYVRLFNVEDKWELLKDG